MAVDIATLTSRSQRMLSSGWRRAIALRREQRTRNKASRISPKPPSGGIREASLRDLKILIKIVFWPPAGHKCDFFPELPCAAGKLPPGNRHCAGPGVASLSTRRSMGGTTNGDTRRHPGAGPAGALGNRLCLHRRPVLAPRRLLLFCRYPPQPAVPAAARSDTGGRARR